MSRPKSSAVKSASGTAAVVDAYIPVPMWYLDDMGLRDARDKNILKGKTEVAPYQRTTTMW